MTHDVKLIMLFLLVAIVALCALFVYVLKKEHQKLVERTSTKYAKLKELNRTFQFAPLEKEKYLYNDCSSKGQFDRQRGYDFLVAMAKESSHWIEDLIFYARKNQILYEEYNRQLAQIKPTSKKRIKSTKTLMSVKTYRKIEGEIYWEEIQHPVLTPTVIVVTSYTSAKGRNTYRKEARFEISDLKNVLKAAEKQNDYAQSREYQRSLMTSSLRYSVLRRDQFRCQICGASAADGVKLEVDHIMPISKGGKTEMNNLRTLCERCNRGKRDRYDPSGAN